MNSNEKDSASMSPEHHAATTPSYQFDKKNVIAKYNDSSCALACPAGGASGRA